ncbi:MAG: SGNH/GDSL hydrolase family protein [Aeromicrobium sp.]
MSSPLPLPIRVLVKGASTVNWTSWRGGPRTDFIFPRVIEEQLLSDGRPCDVQTITMMSEKTSKILGTWEREVLGFSPDVIVLVYGHYETVHLLLPRWLERHANSLKARPRRLESFYRNRILQRVWLLLARLQARLDRIVDPTIRRGRPRRVAADLERFISQVQTVASPLVIVFELLPPAKRYQSWFPGMAARIEVMNRTIADMITRVDKPNVRYFPVHELVDKYCDSDIEVATPDGFHYTPTMHRVVGTQLAEQIAEWADTQPHLAR